MNFLALPFLFPILVIAALVLCPIATIKLGYGCVKGFFHEAMKDMSFGDRIRSLTCVFALVSEMNVKRRVSRIGYGLKLMGAWVTLLMVLVVLVLPFIVLGAVVGIFKPALRMAHDSLTLGFEHVGDFVEGRLDAVFAVADRSVR